MKPVLVDRLNNFPAVALLGPRQVGKTTLAQSLQLNKAIIYLDLENPADKAKLHDPNLYLSQHEDKLVILDEVQRVPELFQILRGLIDEGKRVGNKFSRFLLLGSASIELLRQSGESLAGRIAYLELSPLDILEIKPDEMNKLWIRGGFPDSYLSNDAHQSHIWRENFIRTYLERDIPQLGPRVPAETLRRFWTMLAHNQGGLLNAAQLARGLAVDGKTITRYLDLMVDLLLVRRLMPYHVNVGKRLVKSPKVYIRDTGILHSLLNLVDMENVLSHSIVGMSWEGFIIENLIRSCKNHVDAYFYRTASGAEIDLVLEVPGGKRWAIEIKRSLTPKVEKGFFLACEDIKPDKAFVVYNGHEHYKIRDNIEAIPVTALAAQLAKQF